MFSTTATNASPFFAFRRAFGAFQARFFHPLWRAKLTLLLLLAAGGAAQAGVVLNTSINSQGGDLQGTRNQTVTFSISESALSEFAGAELYFSYQMDSLAYRTDSATAVYGTAFTIEDSNSPVGLAGYYLFLTPDLGPNLSGPLELFALTFDILPNAPLGIAAINFLNIADLPFGDTIYDRPAFSATITVISSVPIPGTLLLCITALGALSLVHRRRQRMPMTASISY